MQEIATKYNYILRRFLRQVLSLVWNSYNFLLKYNMFLFKLLISYIKTQLNLNDIKKSQIKPRLACSDSTGQKLLTQQVFGDHQFRACPKIFKISISSLSLIRKRAYSRMPFTFAHVLIVINTPLNLNDYLLYTSRSKKQVADEPTSRFNSIVLSHF